MIQNVALFLLTVVGVDAWYYRGDSNEWGATELMYNEETGLECICTNLVNGQGFKISKNEDDWTEAYPEANWVITKGDGLYDICFDEFTNEITVGKHEYWYFRGTPNEWGATEMNIDPETGKFCTNQTFEANGAFKVSGSAEDYNEAYPATNFVVSRGSGSYIVCFDSLLKTVTAEKEGEEEWFYRGTSNEWGASLLTFNEELNKLCICTPLENGNEFRVSRYADDWVEAYPSKNWVIYQGAGLYDICFDEVTKVITVGKHEYWYFRGTPNAWGATEMTVAEDGRFCTAQTFAKNGDGFKISSSAENYVEAYPKSNWVIHQGAGTYTVCFDSLYKSLSVVKQA